MLQGHFGVKQPNRADLCPPTVDSPYKPPRAMLHHLTANSLVDFTSNLNKNHRGLFPLYINECLRHGHEGARKRCAGRRPRRRWTSSLTFFTGTFDQLGVCSRSSRRVYQNMAKGKRPTALLTAILAPGWIRFPQCQHIQLWVRIGLGKHKAEYPQRTWLCSIPIRGNEELAFVEE